MRFLAGILTTFFLQFCFLAAGCQAVDSSAISNDEFRLAAAQPGAVILDVRTADEYQQGHISGAKLIDVLRPEEFKNYILALPKDKTYLLYCRSGKRSFTALTLMKENGFTIVKHLKNGITGWDGPVEQ